MAHPIQQRNATSPVSISSSSESETQPAAPFQELPIIRILVGNKKKAFNLSTGFVRRNVPTFAAAIEGLGLEETPKTLALPQANPETFKYVYEWALTQEIEVPKNNGGVNSSTFWSVLGQVYVLAEELKATDLKKYIIDTIYASISAQGYGPDSETIRFIYDKTCATSGLRRMIIAFFVWQAAEGWWEVDPTTNVKGDWAFKDMPEAFKTEVGIKALQRINLMDDGNPFNEDPVTKETDFGPKRFYSYYEAYKPSLESLKKDINEPRAEDAWDADRLEVDQATADDMTFIHDDQDALRQEEQDARDSDDELLNSSDDTSDDPHEPIWTAELAGEDENWLQLVLAVDIDTARQQQPSLSPRAAQLLDLVIEVEDSDDNYHGWGIEEWAEILGSTLGKTHEALQELDDACLVSKV